ncbi:MAG: penicillin-binding protein 2 [Candidatus Melainabacteria bacterium]|nr:penicillin-binding protein 2 [Candidatus Melainabacteria bacterium]
MSLSDPALGPEETEKYAFKAAVLAAVVLGALSLLVARLVWLQIIQNQYYSSAAEENSTRVTFLRAPRGSIYDRHGTLLATNKQSLSMIVIPNLLDKPEELAHRLSGVLNLKYPEVLDRLLKAKASNSVMPVVIERDLDMDLVSRFYDQKIFLPGVDILPDISRTYPHADVTAHVLGYCGEITSAQLKRRTNRRMGDVVGQAGIEKLYDDQLRGVDGEQRMRVNARGAALSPDTAKPVVTKKAIAGLPIVLSLDLDLQRAAFNALGQKSGGIAAMDPQSGEVLVLVSRPSYDPNVFTRRMTKEDRKILMNPLHPLHNRAVTGFPPGSIWKPVTLLAALEYGAVKPDTKLVVSGGITVGGYTFHDWTGAGGTYDLIKCLAWSRDTAFYQMALKMTPEMIKDWGIKMGAGRPTGIELPHEPSGLVPDAEWKMSRLRDKWYAGNTLHMSIGQTYLQVSPLQAARIYAGFGMKGRVPGAHLAIKIGERQVPAPAHEFWRHNPEYMALVREGLKQVVASGTGGRARLQNVSVSGKTGSAEAPPKGSKTHGWFACYAPSDNPEISACAFVEHGGHGGTAAAPLCKAVLEQYFGIANNATSQAPPAAAGTKPKKKPVKPKPARN